MLNPEEAKTQDDTARRVFHPGMGDRVYCAGFATSTHARSSCRD